MGCGISARQKGYQPLDEDANGQARAEKKATGDTTQTKLDPRVREIIQGNLTQPCPATSKIVRIFTSSTFTDTHHERNALMEHAYPVLRSLCQQHGHEFQVVDMRWGVRDEAADDHMATTLCLREVDNCRHLSTGPYFVTFLSHKYGYMDLPREVPSSEFDTLLSANMAEEARSLLQKWYVRDDNAVPAVHVLQPVSQHVPGFLSGDLEQRRAARDTWGKHSAVMQRTLAVAARQTLTREAADKYDVSVTEAELRAGVLDKMADPARCLWFHRVITDLDQHPPSYALSRYTECYGEDVEEKRERMQRLKARLHPSALPSSRCITYHVQWSEKGLDPGSQPQHRAYLQQLCQDFRTAVSDHVMAAVSACAEQQRSLPVVEEVLEHCRFCQAKVRLFHGRQEILERVSGYLEGDSTRPLVIHGPSGYGKTSVLAVAASRAWHLLSGQATVLLRFLGTTPDSSSLLPLLSSLVMQARLARGQHDLDIPLDLREMIQCFKQTLAEATSQRPLVLFLDSLDQLESAGSARQLSWLPATLPAHVKVVVSTLPDQQYESFPRLQALYPDEENMVSVTELSQGEMSTILDQWLTASHRQLTSSQRQLVERALQSCASPLFLRLTFDQACKWHSYSPADVTVLGGTVRESISLLLARLERMHGALLVSRALGFLSLSRRGLSEAELEDMLSCCEDVLNDIYAYWTPPLRRLPPLLLVRLRADLEGYLVDRGTDGVRVFYWYHRQFIEAALERYCSDVTATQDRHAAIADYFAGVWADSREKPFTDKTGKTGSADRHVASQPLRFGNSYNLRKLNNLPWHRLCAGQLDLLKSECLLNYDFLLAKLRGSGLRSVLEDVAGARQVYPEDSDLRWLSQALQLSQDSLLYNPGELPSQLLARLRHCPGLGDLQRQCRQAAHLQVSPPVLTPAGGALLYSVAGDPYRVRGLDLSADGSTLVTWPSQAVEGVKIWTVATGQLRQTLEVGQKVHDVTLCCGDSRLLVELYSGEALLGLGLDTGFLEYKVTGELASCRRTTALGKVKDAIAAAADSCLRVLDAATGTLQWQLEYPQHYQCSSATLISAGGNIIAIAHKSDVMTFDLSAKASLTLAQILPEGAGARESIAGMCVSPDGSTLYVTGRVDTDIRLYDPATLTLLKTFAGSKSETPGDFHVTPSGSHLYYAGGDCLVTWDVSTGERTAFLSGASKFSDVRTTDMRTAVSIGQGNTIKIWDLALAEKSRDVASEEFVSRKLRFLARLPSPRYVLVQEECERRLGQGSVSFLSLYDLASHAVLSKTDLGDVQPSRLLVVGEWEAVYIRGQTLVTLDLHCFRETRVFQGSVSPVVDLALHSPGRELLACSADRKQVLLFSLETGANTHTFSLPESSGEDIEKLITSERGSVLAVRQGDRTIHLYSLQSRSLLYTLGRLSVGDQFAYRPLVTEDGRFLVTECYDGPAPTAQQYRAEGQYGRKTFPVVWNIHKACIQSQLRSFEGYKTHLYRLLDSGTLAAISVSNSDHRLRLFSLHSGKLLLESQPAPGLYHKMEVLPVSPFLVSYSEKTVWVWDRDTLQSLASLTLERDTLREVFLSGDGRHVVGVPHEGSRLVVFTLGGRKEGEGEGGQEPPFARYPELASSETVFKLQLLSEENSDQNPQ